MVGKQATTRHPIVLSSDDEKTTSAAKAAAPKNPVLRHNRSPKKSVLPTRSGKGAAQGRRNEGQSESKSATPKKLLRTKKADQPANISKRTLDSFFNAATQRLDSAPSTAHAAPQIDEEDFEDIEDGSDGQTRAVGGSGVSGRSTGAALRKRSWTDADHQRGSRDAPAARNKFLKTPSGRRSSTPLSHKSSPAEDAGQSWTEKFPPLSLEELAVHHKKVGDVRTWLERVLTGQQYQKLLVMRGAAGTGKTATMALLSKLLGYSIIEWKNPGQSLYDTEDFVSATSRLADFLSRAGQFAGLEMTKLRGPDETPPTASATKARTEKQILVMEEFPSISGSSSTASVSFREQLLQYLAMSIRSVSARGSDPARTIAPLVLIISESVLSDNNSADNFTAHRLLGSEILHHPGVTVIDFNPVAPTILSKALKLVIKKQSSSSGGMRNVGGTVMQRLAEVGDIRNAISTLEYLCTTPSTADALSLPVKTAKKAKAAKSKGATKADDAAEHAALSVIALRQTTLGLFHAVGKVVYNKRGEEISNQELPPSASTRTRPPADLDVDGLLSTTGTDTAVFLSALHENYLLSCTDQYGDDETTLDSVTGCIDSLSDSDMLGSHSGRQSGFKSSYAAAVEGMRQDELSFHVGVLGLQNALPYPVKRQCAAANDGRPNIAHRGGKGDAHRMFYPMDLKLWRLREEIQGSLDFLVERALDGRLDAALPALGCTSSKLTAKTVIDCRGISQPGRMATQAPTSQQWSGERPTEYQKSDLSAAAYVAIASGQSARKMMLLERLPYLQIVMTAASVETRAPSGSFVKEINQVASFSGAGVRRDEESDDEVETRISTGVKAAGTDVSERSGLQGVVDNSGMEKLVLSDDDIVDDD